MTNDEKVALMMERFLARTDAWARFYEKKEGGKVVEKGYLTQYKYGPDYPKNKNDRTLIPLTKQVLVGHLTGRHNVGVYPLIPPQSGEETDYDGHTTAFLAVDVDDHHGKWGGEELVRQTLNAAETIRAAGWPVLIERSKSGNGYHLWCFFEEPQPAWRIRRIALALLQRAGLYGTKKDAVRSAFDRIFPLQDNYKRGKSFGNCIALPLWKPARENENAVFIDPDSLAPLPDQWAVLRDAELVETADVMALAKEFEVVPPGNESRDTPFAKGDLGSRPGVLNILDNCAFIEHCRSEPSTLEEPLWYALACNLMPFDGGREAFHEISALDHARYDKDATDAKADHALASLEEVGPQTCATLAQIGFPCDRGCEERFGYKSPASWGRMANSVSLDDLIGTIASMSVSDDPMEKYRAIRGMLEKVVMLKAPLMRKQAIAELSKRTKTPKGDLNAELDQMIRERQQQGDAMVDPLLPLSEQVDLLWRNTSSKTPGFYASVARVVWRWFTDHGGLFLWWEEDEFLWYDGKLYGLVGDIDFDALIQELTGLVRTESAARNILAALRNLTRRKGQETRRCGWSSYDQETNALWFDLGLSEGHILEVLPEGRFHRHLNALNDRRLVLQRYDKMTPVAFIENVDISHAMHMLRWHFLTNLACKPSDAYLVTCWALSVMLMPISSSRPLLRLAGTGGSGKSMAARLIGELIYGNYQVEKPSAAAAWTLASSKPYMGWDNLEDDGRTQQVEDFLLSVATGAERQKRRVGTDRGVVTDRVDCMVALTSTQPLQTYEIRSRAMEVQFSSEYWRAGYDEAQTLAGLREARSEIFSAVLHLISNRVLPAVASGRRQQLLDEIGFMGSEKKRLADHFTLMVYLLEAMWDYLPLDGYEDGHLGLVRDWVATQDVQQRDDDQLEDPMVTGLQWLYQLAMANSQNDFENTYGIQVETGGEATQVEFTCTAQGLLGALAKATDYYKVRPSPIKATNPMSLMKLVKRSLTNMEAAGWIVEKGVGTDRSQGNSKQHRFSLLRDSEYGPSNSGGYEEPWPSEEFDGSDVAGESPPRSGSYF